MVLYSDGQSNSTKKKFRRLPRFVPIRSFQEITRRDQGQNLQNHVETYPELRETREEWVISIKEKMEQTHREDATSSWDELCIYRVPCYLQENDNKSYFPQTVSLGPYHYGKEHLLPMEYHKWRAVNMVTKRTKQRIELYIDAMKELEEKARACYQGPIDMSSNKFIEMLVLDGCFVLELFKGTIDGFPEIGYAPNDPIFAMGGLMHWIQRDMVMLENQLPLFVLDKLLGLQFKETKNRTGTLAKAVVRFFKPVMPTSEVISQKEEPIDWNEGVVDPLGDNDELHCLDVFHRSLFRTFPSLRTPNRKTRRYISFRNKSKVNNGQQQQMIHCVTELREAGVKFRSKETDQLWDIGFNNGYLEIPKLLIHDSTKSLFSNLIAFEQCHIYSSDIITSYLIFMDNLINSSHDVSYLHQFGILEHWLGSDSEVADLFNQLCKEVVFHPKDSYLSKLSGEVNRYHGSRWNSLKATLKHKYFSNPWAYIAFFAAVTLLILTFTQTLYGVLAYYKPSS